MTHLLLSRLRVMLVLWLSMVACGLHAHETEPMVADVDVSADEVEIQLRTSLEPLIAGVDLSLYTNTNDAPEAAETDRLRALSPDELGAALGAAWPTLREKMTLTASTPLVPRITGLRVEDVADVELRREAVVKLTAALPEDDSPVTLSVAPDWGGLIVRQGDAETGYTAYLTGGASTEPMPRSGAVDQSLGDVVLRYLVSGFDHIVPQGLDHILFVLGLFFYALAWRPLLWQVTAFTAAHTVTLALATLGIVTIPDGAMWIVEAIIAASITYVAVENLWRINKSREMAEAVALGGPVDETQIEDVPIGWTRIGVVFAFGLLHGLGFASVLAEFGLGQYFVASLIAFNVGVELGQLFVIAVAFLIMVFTFRTLGRRFTPVAEGFHAVAVYGSILIGLTGLWWVIERTLLG